MTETPDGEPVPDAPDPPSDPPRPVRPLLSWPPPGLNRIQGDLHQATRRLLIGGVVLVLPLLGITTSEQPFYSLGPLGDSWWVILLTSAVGLWIVVSGMVDLARLASRVGRARARGYGLWTLLLVITDDQREAGFILQGSRSFSGLGAGGRRRLLVARVAVAFSLFLAAAWLSLGFVVGIVLAGRDAISPAGLTLFTLFPPGLLFLFGAAVWTWERRLTRRLRRIWHQRPWSDDLAVADVHDWQDEAQSRTGQVGLVTASGGSRFPYTVAGLGVVVVGVGLLVFTVVLSVTSALSPLLATISTPAFSTTQARMAQAEFLRRYRLSPDTTIGALEGGRLLHTLANVAGPPPRALELPPEEVHEETWIPGGPENPTGMQPSLWARDLFGALARGEIDARGLAFLAEVAEHPAHEAFARAGVAPAADLVGSRYPLPLPEGASIWSLPLPDYRVLREGAYAHVARAVHLARLGRVGEAERVVREVIGVGLLLADEGTFLIDNLVGLVIADTGAEALLSFYRYAGREDEASTLEWVRSTAESATEIGLVGRTKSAESVLREMPAVILDDDALRGLRWSHLNTLNTLAPCLNLNRMVFGPDPEYAVFLEDAEEELVRYPGEAELFELSRQGLFGRKGERDAGWLAPVLSIPLGGREIAGSCADLYREIG